MHQHDISPAFRETIERLPFQWQRRILINAALAGEAIDPSLLSPVDYSYRPASYWTEDSLRRLLTNIKGAERKRAALKLLDAGRLDEATAFILADSLTDADRNITGKIHPGLMGGEYLPDYLPGEVEIARITMASITQDVISIRAFPNRGRIGFRVVNEYESTYRIRPKTSKRPLDLRQLIHLIDTASSDDMGPICLGILQTHVDCCEIEPQELVGFMEFTSEFYLDLRKHYWFAVNQWVQQNRRH